MVRKFVLGAAVAMLAAGAGLALVPSARAEDSIELLKPNPDFSFVGPFGTFDRASAQRGLQIYKEVCSACHRLVELSYRARSRISRRRIR